MQNKKAIVHSILAAGARLGCEKAKESKTKSEKCTGKRYQSS